MIDVTGSYCGTAPDAATWTSRWNGDPLVLVLLSLAMIALIRVPHARQSLVAGAIATLAIIFLSPLCALSVALFSARTLHHLLLIGVAAPLFALALPWRARLSPPAALAIATVVLWAWHLPAFYDAALANKAIYWAMQTSLLATALIYWLAVRHAEPPLALALIGAGAAQMGLLGALLTFVAQPLYVTHLATTASFGIGPLADQQLAGLAMWIVGLVPYAVIGAVVAHSSWRRMATA